MKIETPPTLKGKTTEWTNLESWLKALVLELSKINVKGQSLNISPVPNLASGSDDREWNSLSKWLAVMHSQIGKPFAHSFPIVTKTTTATLRVEEIGIVFVDSTAAPFTITLPQAAKIGVGGWFQFIKTDASSNAVTLDGSGAETINGAATEASLNAQYDFITIFSTGSAWITVNIPPYDASLISSGVLPLARGGTSKGLTAANGGIVYSDADSLEILAATATAGQVLRSGLNSAPSWSTATYPATVAANRLLYGSSANVVSDLASANNAFLVTDGSGVPSLGKAYLEDTHTPVVTLVGGAGNVVPDYATVSGRYLRVGNHNIYHVRLNNSSGGTAGAGSGEINISLPIAVSASQATLYQSAFLKNGSNSYIGLIEIPPGASTVTLFYYPTISTLSSFTGVLQDNASRQIDFTIVYEV